MTRPNDQYGVPIGGVTLLGAAAGYALPIKASAASLFTRATNAAAATASGNSGDLNVSEAAEVCVDVSVTALSGTSPQIQFTWERKGSDGVYYPLWTSAAFTAPGTASITFGPGAGVPQAVGLTGRLSWAVTGTSPSVTFSASVIRD